jgi:hypothetical protein
MRSALMGLALLDAAAMGTSAQAATTPTNEPSLVQPVWWDGGYDSDYCGPRCQEHRWRRHQRWEERRQYWQDRQWDRPSYGYYAPPRSYGYSPPPGYYGYSVPRY